MRWNPKRKFLSWQIYLWRWVMYKAMNVVNLNSVRQIHSGNNRKYLRQQFLYIYPKLSRIFTRTVKSSNEKHNQTELRDWSLSGMYIWQERNLNSGQSCLVGGRCWLPKAFSLIKKLFSGQHWRLGKSISNLVWWVLRVQIIRIGHTSGGHTPSFRDKCFQTAGTYLQLMPVDERA